MFSLNFSNAKQEVNVVLIRKLSILLQEATGSPRRHNPMHPKDLRSKNNGRKVLALNTLPSTPTGSRPAAPELHEKT